MDNMKRIPIFFIEVKQFIQMYRKNEDINLRNLGIITDQKIILSQVFYADKKIISRPYSLFANKDSFNIDRNIILKYIIEELIIKHYDKGNSHRTITTAISKCFNFIDWCNNEKLNFIKNIEMARNVFILYTNFLRESIRTGKYSQGEAHTKHMASYKLLVNIFNDTKNIIGNGINIIPNKRLNNISASAQEDKKYHFNFYYSFFNQVAKFLIENEKYPLSLKLPQTHIWCIPSTTKFITTKSNCPMAFNIKDGSLFSEEEIFSQNKLKFMRDARWARKNFSKTLQKNNSDKYSKNRLYLGTMALQAYYIVFLSITGMNDSTAATLLWDDKYEIENNKQKFKNIKYRAGNKPVEFQIQSKFIKDFKKFLQLRKYLLKGSDFNYLFFMKNGQNAELSKRQKQGAFSSIINKRFIDTVDINLPRINSKELRVNKTNQAIRDNGIIAASQLAQSSVNTIINTYLGESQETADEQFDKYFSQLNDNLFNYGSNEKETSIGRCKSPNNPKIAIDLKGIDTNCNKSEGCLFCEHYGIHADYIDIQKIYSLKFIINESKYLAKNELQFNNMYGIILKRIDNILFNIKSLGEKESKDVEFYKKDVFENENLHPYWEYKLNTLIQMGVL